MKRTLLVSSLLFMGVNVIAQPTIQSSDFYPTIGESFTLNYGSYVSPGPEGNNVTWDLSGITATSVIHVNALTANPNYSGSTITVEYQGSSDLHANLTPTGYLIVGESTNTVSATYTDPKKLYQFPMTIGTSYIDPFSGSVISNGATLSRTGSVTSEVDGYGTLITPSGTYTDVLRVHSVHTNTDTYMGQSATGTIDMYTWIKAGVHCELAGVQSFIAPGGTQNIGYYATNTLGISDNTLNTLALYPNPAQNLVMLQHEQHIDRVEVRDLNGRVAAVDFNTSNQSIDISGLSTGVYYVTVYSDNHTAVKKLMKQ